MAPSFLRSNYSDLFGSSMLPVLEELFRSELAMHEQKREKIFKKVMTDRDIWQSSEIHDLPLFNQMEEAQDYSFYRQNQGVSKTLKPVKFGLGFSISEEAVADGKWDFIADAVKKMAKSAKESQEISAMNILNNGFASELSADGQFVFDTDHTLPSGLTFRNELSAAADLSATSLEQMLIDFETQFIGDSGIIYNIKPKVLLVAPSNRRYAQELIGSDLKADTADNNINSLKQDGLIVVSSPHLTDPDAWFLLADPSETGLRIIERQAIQTKAAGQSEGFINDSVFYKASYRERVGVTHPMGIFGSPGV
jgi:phage major head subunit gpT-like protein